MDVLLEEVTKSTQVSTNASHRLQNGTRAFTRVDCMIKKLQSEKLLGLSKDAILAIILQLDRTWQPKISQSK